MILSKPHACQFAANEGFLANHTPDPLSFKGEGDKGGEVNELS
jgi:hypothetical protein